MIPRPNEIRCICATMQSDIPRCVAMQKGLEVKLHCAISVGVVLCWDMLRIIEASVLAVLRPHTFGSPGHRPSIAGKNPPESLEMAVIPVNPALPPGPHPPSAPPASPPAGVELPLRGYAAGAVRPQRLS